MRDRERERQREREKREKRRCQTCSGFAQQPISSNDSLMPSTSGAEVLRGGENEWGEGDSKSDGRAVLQACAFAFDESRFALGTFMGPIRANQPMGKRADIGRPSRGALYEPRNSIGRRKRNMAVGTRQKITCCWRDSDMDFGEDQSELHLTKG